MIILKPDKPIVKKDDDLLSRKQFAEDIAETITNYNHSESLVVGIYGEWGSGKTSIINMIKETFNELKEKGKSTNVVDFNPWIYADLTDLIHIYFEIIKQELIKINKDGYKDLIKLINDYSFALDLIPNVGIELIIAKKVLKFVTNIYSVISKKRHKQKENNVINIKNKINNILETIDGKIVIIIDDIDRLPSSDIKKIFQLIRIIADFKNIVYLLTFDYKVVSNSLHNEQNKISGKEYLDKIVQIPLKVPFARQQDIINLLLNEIKDVYSIDKNTFEWKTPHEMKLLQSNWLTMFITLRNVKRFINLLKFEYVNVKEKVNRVDFLLIISLKIFFPEVYNQIYFNKQLLTGTRRSFPSIVEDIKKNDKRLMDLMIKKISEDFKSKYINLFYELFPYVDQIYNNNHWSEMDQKEARKEGRICATDNFDSYFTSFSLDNHLSFNEIENTIMNIQNQEDFEQTLLNLNQRKILWDFFYRFSDYIYKNFNKDSIIIIINSFLNIGDKLDESSREINTMPMFSSWLIIKIIFDLLKLIKDENKRFNILKESIEKSKYSLYAIVNIVNNLEGNYNNKRVEDDPEVILKDKKYIENLINSAVNKIREYQKNNKLKEVKKLDYILECYSDWEKDEIYNDVFNGLIKDDDDLINLLKHFIVSTVHYQNDVIIKKTIQLNIKSLKRVCPKDQDDIIYKRVTTMFKEKLKYLPEQQELINIFMESINKDKSSKN